jgi:hypothetical protein
MVAAAVTALCLAAAVGALLLAAIRHTIRWSCDERTEVRDQRRTTPPPDDCWISPDEESKFEEITAALRTSRRTSREVPPC